MTKTGRSLSWLTLIALAFLSLTQSARTASPPEALEQVDRAIRQLHEAQACDR